ncbi:MAG TPA: universal stress protein [Acidobacteriaceae bacterium]
MYKHLAVAYEEGHPESKRAFQHALAVAKLLSQPLKVLTIAEPLPAYAAFSAAADLSAMHTLEQDKSAYYEQWRGRVVDEGNAQGVEISAYLLEGNSVHAITSFVAQHDIDLLIVGLHKRALRISSLWSTVYTLAQDLNCSVLGVH